MAVQSNTEIIELNRIYNEDCLQGMKRIPDNSIDLVVTDPPYNIAKDNNFNSMGRKGIDFGDWDKGADILSYINELPRITTKNASVIVFNDWKNLGDICRQLEKNGFIIKDCIRWVKSNPMPRNRDRRYITDYEMAVWAVKKGAKWVFNRKDEKYQRPEFNTPLVQGKEKSHPTQKPVSLIQELIEIHSVRGQTVLDCFMGSGTSAIACMNADRNFIGFELDKEYYSAATARIEDHEKLFKTGGTVG